MLVARVQQLEGGAKLVLALTGPWRVVSGGFRHVHEVQDIVRVENMDVHVAWMRSCANTSLKIRSKVWT